MTTTDAVIVSAIMREAARLASGNSSASPVYGSQYLWKEISDENINQAIAAFNTVKEKAIKEKVIKPSQKG